MSKDWNENKLIEGGDDTVFPVYSDMSISEVGSESPPPPIWYWQYHCFRYVEVTYQIKKSQVILLCIVIFLGGDREFLQQFVQYVVLWFNH